jgi:hypothetical protein
VTREPSRLPAWQLWLERITSGVLLAVIAALGWMIVVANQPGWLRLSSPTAEVIVILTLLVSALLLVSLVALLHTRSGRPHDVRNSCS